MKVTISRHDAIQDLLDDQFAGWTREGATAIVDYLEQIEFDIEPAGGMHFDPVAIRCGWSEYPSIAHALKEYDLDTIEQLERETTVLRLGAGGIVVEMF